MVKQTDEWFKIHNPSIYTHGCLFLSLVATREDFANLSHAAINAMYKGCVELGHITENKQLKAFVNSYDGILEAVQSKYRWRSRIEIKYDNIQQLLDMAGYDTAIIRYATNFASHFTLLNNGKEYNPYQKPASYNLELLGINRIDLLRKIIN
ncbi:MAG: hypothetical protein FWE37_02225 [Spirochaetaceae bacterium]|nr:hypothetical protein [Spirochaetaceae bacterium]